jgi:hypothetical protein
MQCNKVSEYYKFITIILIIINNYRKSLFMIHVLPVLQSVAPPAFQLWEGFSPMKVHKNLYEQKNAIAKKATHFNMSQKMIFLILMY